MSHVRRDSAGALPAYAWPGGYPVFYLLEDGETLCADCANGKNGSDASELEGTDPQWHMIAHGVNWEDQVMTCAHCNSIISSAYGLI